MNEWLDNILLNYVTFVSLFSPPATITAATIILGRIDRNILWQIAWKIAAGYTLVMLVVIWLGNWLLTALGLATPLARTLQGLALTFDNPPGQRQLAISIDPGTFGALAAGAALVAFGLVLREAVRLSDENQSFV